MAPEDVIVSRGHFLFFRRRFPPGQFVPRPFHGTVWDCSADDVQTPALEEGVEIVEDDLETALHGFHAGKGHVGREDAVGGAEKGVVLGQRRLLLEDVEGHPGYLALFKRPCQRLFPPPDLWPC